MVEGQHPFDEMKSWVGFTEDDSARLRNLLPYVEPELAGISERFYATILKFPAAARVFRDEAQVARLKMSLQNWMRELLSGPHDHDYFERRTRIGRRHVEVGLKQQYMFTAMNQLRQELSAIAVEKLAEVACAQTCVSLMRITDLELAVMLGTYVVDQNKKEMEGLRDLLVSHLPMTALLLDAQGRVTTSTGALKRFLGRGQRGADGDVYGHRTPGALKRFLGRGQRAGGEHYSELLPPEILAAVHLSSHLERVDATRAESVVPRVDVTLGGVKRCFRMTVVPLEHPVVRTLVHFDDLSDVLAFEARVRQTENLTQLGSMSAAIAHEIRNPLAGISGTMQVVMRSLAEDDRRKGVLSKVLQQIERLNQLVEDLLQFSKPVVASCSATDLRTVAMRVASGVAAASMGNTRVTGQGSAHADGMLLQLALHNLVQNAWQAGAKTVQVVVTEGKLQVVDDGPGIPAEKRDEIFRPFFTTRVRGTGLGLPNAQRVVEAMGGTLTLAPSPLGGACFEIHVLVSPVTTPPFSR